MGVLVPRGVFFPYLSILFIIMGLFAGNAPSVFADTTYTYTGNAFDVFTGSATCPAICSVSGSFSVSSPIMTSSDSSTAPLLPTIFSFTDGNTILTPGNASSVTFDVSTDKFGNIKEWSINLQGISGVEILTEFTGSAFEATDLSFSSSGEGFLQGNRGTWVTTTPEPSTFLLLGLGLLAVLALISAKGQSRLSTTRPVS